jgi:hypothetical protein
MTEKYVKERISANIIDKVSREYVTSVLLKENLTEEEVLALESKKMRGIYVNNFASLYINPQEISSIDAAANILQIAI